jgi:pSer/pThr/pTyr-binding forkhead associated (FHA) protein
MIKVFIANRLQHGHSYVIEGKTAQIGRGPSNHVRLNDPSVSRKHVKIYRDNGQYFIEDLQSRNGTWINGDVIASGVRLHIQEGVSIDVGNVLMSLGKKCPPTRLPNEYSIAIGPPGGRQSETTQLR